MNWHGQCKATGGGSDEPLDKFIYERYFPGVTSGRAIECGATDGLYFSNCLALEQMGWTVINIEASWPNFEKLRVNRPKCFNYFKALSDIDGEVVDSVRYDGDNGGADRVATCEPTKFSKRFRAVATHPVPTVRYSSLIIMPIDLFVLDVEGSELMVLDGMKGSIFWPTILCIEHAHISMREIQNRLLGKYDLDHKDDLNAIFKIKEVER